MCRSSFMMIALIVTLVLPFETGHAQDVSNSDVDALYNDLFGTGSDSETLSSGSTGTGTTRSRRKRNRSKSSTATETTADATATEYTSDASTDAATDSTSDSAAPTPDTTPASSPTVPEPTPPEPVEVIPSDADIWQNSAISDDDEAVESSEDEYPEEDAVTDEEITEGVELAEDSGASEETLPEPAEPELQEPVATDVDVAVDSTATATTEESTPDPNAAFQDNPLTADPETFTGTLSDEDDANIELQRQNALFGSDEAEPDEEEFKAGAKYYNIKMEYTAQVVFAEAISGDPYMEVTYVTHFEKETIIGERRIRVDTDGIYNADVTGSLARTELFDCPLDVAMEKTDVDIMTRLNKTETTPDQAGSTQLALQVKFKKKANETWSVKCEGMGGMLMSRGDKEEYNFQALDNITPSLSGYLDDDFNPYTITSIDLTTEAFLIDDQDTRDLITVSGSGTLTIEPIENPAESEESDVTVVETEKNKKSTKKSKKKKIDTEDESDVSIDNLESEDTPSTENE